MAFMEHHQISKFLNLPREIRDQIIGEVFFPGEKEPDEFDQDRLGLKRTAIRQILPYTRDENRKPRFDVAIIRTCRQLQMESEPILYGSSSWNLMYQDWADANRLSYEFFQRFPTRLRRLIRRVERKCYSEPYRSTISLTDWTLFMTFLARECPNLQSLKLWGPGDRNEGPPWVRTCNMEKEWVQAILQIKSLAYFDIPVIKNGNIYDFPEFADEFLPRLKESLLQKSYHQPRTIEWPVVPNTQDIIKPFRLLDLDLSIRRRIYRHLLLPLDCRVHPCIGLWYDQTTKNTMSIFLTCHQIHKEAEEVLYSTGVFTSPIKKYDAKLLRFFSNGNTSEYRESLSPRLLSLVKYVRIGHGPPFNYALFAFMAKSMNLESLQLICDDESNLGNINTRIHSWSSDGHLPSAYDLSLIWLPVFPGSQLRHLGRIRGVQIEVPQHCELHPACLDWPTVGVRNEVLSRTDFDPGMDWLHDDKDDDFTALYDIDSDQASDRGPVRRFRNPARHFPRAPR